MKFLLAFLIFPALATYTYTVTMENPEQAIFMATNMLAAAAWTTLGFLIYMSRARHAPPIVRAWVYPLTAAMKIFCGISAVRYLMSNLAIYYPVAQTVQAGIYIINVMALVWAVGYASVYYKRIPEFLRRLTRHQALSRRFTVIQDIATDGFLETDAQGNIWYSNPAAADMFGMRDSEEKPDPRLLLGHNLVDDFMIGETQKMFAQMRETYQATGTAAIVNRREPTKVLLKRVCMEPFFAEITVSEYEIGTEKRFCIIVRDISYRVALEESQKG